MKLTNVITGAFILAFFAFAPIVSKAQDNRIDRRHDRRDIRHDERRLVRNKALRNRAIENGRPVAACREERKVQRDRADIRHDRRDLRRDRRGA